MTTQTDLEKWQQAFGLMTTLAPDLEIDITDPLGMAWAIERHVLAERAALAAANARAEAAEQERDTLRYALDITEMQHKAAVAVGYDVAAQAAASAQNLREALAAATQRAEAAERERDEIKLDWVEKSDILAQSIQAVEAAELFKQSAEAAEAKLAAVPVEALRQLRTHLSNDGDYSITRTDGEQMWIGDSLVLGSLFEKIDAWLAQQSEAQP